MNIKEELEKCKQSPIYFMENYCKVKKGNAYITIELNTIQKEFLLKFSDAWINNNI